MTKISTTRAQPVVRELGNCVECWWAVLAAMTGTTVGLMPEHGPRVVAAFDQLLAQAREQIAAAESDGRAEE